MENWLNIYALVFLPLIAGLLIFCGFFRGNVIITRRFAKWFSLFYLIYNAAFFYSYNINMQFNYTLSSKFYLLSALKSHLSFAQDILSSLLCTLGAFVVLICFLCAKSTILNKHRIYYSFVLFLQCAFCAILCAQDFYVFLTALFFEMFCVYVLVSNFSLSKGSSIASSYLIQNFFGTSLCVIALGILYAIYQSSYTSLSIQEIAASSEGIAAVAGFVCFCSFFILSMLKIPVFALHKPLKDIISSLNPSLIWVYLCEFMLGVFIFIKFNMYIFNDIFKIFVPIIAVLGIIDICYFGALAIKEHDLRKSFSYFCFSQSGIILVALSSMSPDGISGAVFELVSLVLAFLGLFLCFSFIAQVFKTSKLPLMGGLVTKAPKLSACTFLLVLIGIAMPFCCTFAGRFLSILGGFSTQINSPAAVWTSTFFAAAGFILGSLYLIKVFQKAFFGPNILGASDVKDLLRHRFIALGSICLICIVLGFMPQIILNSVAKYADMIISTFLI